MTFVRPSVTACRSVPDIHVTQRFTIRINEDQSTTLLKFEVRGDPACDPI